MHSILVMHSNEIQLMRWVENSFNLLFVKINTCSSSKRSRTKWLYSQLKSRLCEICEKRLWKSRWPSGLKLGGTVASCYHRKLLKNQRSKCNLLIWWNCNKWLAQDYYFLTCRSVNSLADQGKQKQLQQELFGVLKNRQK